MSDIQELEHRITELEIQTALQEDLIGSLNDTIAKMQQALDLQQGQLRLLYQRMQDKVQTANANRTACATRFRRIIDKLKRACWIHALFFITKPSESQSSFQTAF